MSPGIRHWGGSKMLGDCVASTSRDHFTSRQRRVDYLSNILNILIFIYFFKEHLQWNISKITMKNKQETPSFDKICLLVMTLKWCKY